MERRCEGRGVRGFADVFDNGRVEFEGWEVLARRQDVDYPR